jgi:hypothetical protein
MLTNFRIFPQSAYIRKKAQPIKIIKAWLEKLNIGAYNGA